MKFCVPNREIIQFNSDYQQVNSFQTINHVALKILPLQTSSYTTLELVHHELGRFHKHLNRSRTAPTLAQSYRMYNYYRGLHFSEN